MSETIAAQAAEENNAENVKEPRLGWMIGFLFLVSFVGLFAVVPLRKVTLNSLSASRKCFLGSLIGSEKAIEFTSGDDC